MKQGPHEAHILEACWKRGAKIPEAMANAPELPESLGFYYDAFFDLSTCRGAGGPIPWTAMVQYAEWLGLRRGEELDRFIYLMKEMDAERNLVQEEQAKKGG